MARTIREFDPFAYGPEHIYKYGVKVDYYLRHKKNGTKMDFCIIGQQTYDAFSLAKLTIIPEISPGSMKSLATISQS